MQTHCRPLLGTFVEISVPPDATAALEAGFAAIARVQACMSFHEETSDLARLRRAPPDTAVEVAPETAEVLRIALDLHVRSGGLFDVTVGRELMRDGFLPCPPGSRFRRYSGDSRDIEILGERQVRCRRPVLIDLGGIAKGYAVDQAVGALRDAGAGQGLVNAGGDLRMFGPFTWDIAFRDADESVREIVAFSDCAIASSANLLNRRRRLGRLRTPHIGIGRRPVAHPGRVTVVADRCVIADAMTKIAMAAPDIAERLLASHDGHLMFEAPRRNAA